MDDFQQAEMTKEEEREYREDRFNEKILSHRVSEEELKEILEEKKKQREKYKEICEKQSADRIWALVKEDRKNRR